MTTPELPALPEPTPLTKHYNWFPLLDAIVQVWKDQASYKPGTLDEMIANAHQTMYDWRGKFGPMGAIAADRAARAEPAADEREARQTRAPRVLAKARRVSEHSNAWNVMIGNTCVRQWMQGTYGDGPYRTAQESAEAFAAAINAELDGGVAAFGCIGESDYKKRPCMTWCGSARCAATRRAIVRAAAALGEKMP